MSTDIAYDDDNCFCPTFDGKKYAKALQLQPLL